MEKIKIFENDTILNCIKKCLAEGYFPATIEEIKELKEKGLIDARKWYDTSTLSYKKETRKAMLLELKNFEKIWNKGGRLWFVNGRSLDSYANGNLSLSSDNGRLVGVVPEAQSGSGYPINQERTGKRSIT